MTVLNLETQQEKAKKQAKEMQFEATMKVATLLSYANIGDNAEFIRQYNEGFLSASEMLVHIVVATELRLDLALAILAKQEADAVVATWCPKKKRTRRGA